MRFPHSLSPQLRLGLPSRAGSWFLAALALLSACAADPAPQAEAPQGSAPDQSSESQAGADKAQAEKASESGAGHSNGPEAAPPIELRFARAPVPWLGVRLEATEAPDAGVKITHVFAGSPAQQAGLREGDVIVSLDDSPMLEPLTVANWVRAQKANRSHPINILRDGSARLVRITLEGRPEFEDRLRLELVNRPAPEIAGVATFQGEASSLGELRGQVVVLEFWASYCGVCRYLAPRLDEWHRTYQPQGAEVVGITVDPPQLGRRVAQRTGMTYTLASDPQAKVTQSYMADQIPVVIIIDRKGIVRDAMVGYSERRLRETEKLISELLSQGSSL